MPVINVTSRMALRLNFYLCEGKNSRSEPSQTDFFYEKRAVEMIVSFFPLFSKKEFFGLRSGSLFGPRSILIGVNRLSRYSFLKTGAIFPGAEKWGKIFLGKFLYLGRQFFPF